MERQSKQVTFLCFQEAKPFVGSRDLRILTVYGEAESHYVVVGYVGSGLYLAVVTF